MECEFLTKERVEEWRESRFRRVLELAAAAEGDMKDVVVEAFTDALEARGPYCRAVKTDGSRCGERGTLAWSGIYLCPRHEKRLVLECLDIVAGALREGKMHWHELVSAGIARHDPQVLRRQSRSPSYVYFARSKLGGNLIKIGVTSNLAARMRDLKAEAFAVVATEQAGRLEAILHRRFRAWRREGEWFEPAPALLEWATRLHNVR